MDPPKVLPELAALERRAIMLYRAHAARFSDTPSMSLLWWQMSESEAGHFAALTLASDLLDAAEDATRREAVQAAAPDEPTQALYRRAEAEAASGATPAAAVETACRLAQSELARIRTLLAVLAGRARATILCGVLPAFATGLDCLESLAIASGRADLLIPIQALQAEVMTLRLG